MITEAQRAERRLHVGASDIPALLGLDPWGKSPTDVFWEKVAETPDTQTKSTDAGNRLEQVLIEFAQQRTGLPLVPNVRLVHENGILAANLDAIHEESGVAVEAKMDSVTAREWGTEGTDEVPMRVLVQAQAQIACGAACVWVPALIIDRSARFGLYRVEPHRELIGYIVETVERFWREHVTTMVPPDGNPVPPLEVLAHMTRGRFPIRLDESALELVAAFEAANAARKAAEAAEEEAKRAVLALLGDADEALLPDGRRLTFFTQKSTPSVDYVLMRTQFTEAFADCVKQGTHRRLLIRKK